MACKGESQEEVDILLLPSFPVCEMDFCISALKHAGFYNELRSEKQLLSPIPLWIETISNLQRLWLAYTPQLPTLNFLGKRMALLYVHKGWSVI